MQCFFLPVVPDRSLGLLLRDCAWTQKQTHGINRVSALSASGPNWSEHVLKTACRFESSPVELQNIKLSSRTRHLSLFWKDGVVSLTRRNCCASFV